VVGVTLAVGFVDDSVSVEDAVSSADDGVLVAVDAAAEEGVVDGEVVGVVEWVVVGVVFAGTLTEAVGVGVVVGVGVGVVSSSGVDVEVGLVLPPVSAG